ncbi:hypothetical protein FS837_006881, partial [Tulasnella sp. UAMH 9824]
MIMDPESVVQPGAAIQQPGRTPTPLEGTIKLQEKPSALGGYSIIYKAKWIRGEEESLVCVKWLQMNPGDDAVRGLSKEGRLQR